MPIIGIMASANWSSANASSFESIATATGDGSSGTITFSSIPQTYKHLQIRFIGKSTQTSGTRRDFKFTFNSLGSPNYSNHQLIGNGSIVETKANPSWSAIYAESAIIDSGPASTMTAGIIDIHDYASTSKNKTVRMFLGVDTNDSQGAVQLNSGLGITTSAISSITISLASNNWTTSTQFALYGIKGA